MRRLPAAGGIAPCQPAAARGGGSRPSTCSAASLRDLGGRWIRRSGDRLGRRSGRRQLEHVAGSRMFPRVRARHAAHGRGVEDAATSRAPARARARARPLRDQLETRDPGRARPMTGQRALVVIDVQRGVEDPALGA